ncbi:MAG: hypothetical protein EAZ99_14135 [Alphaproteobacteria bacterium]|nr:TIGR02186 family protein [Alphaproteobacteria bacterium]TAD88314.1 MAG: hypothetical protein EAZ99_14135 [Alphaproteobacteria bacterium]
MSRLLWVLALLLCLPVAARAQSLAFDITAPLIAVTTGFTGAEVVVFGAIDSEGDLIVTLRAPDQRVTVRRKARVLGLWLNREAVEYPAVPGYYAIAATRPVEEIARPETLARHRLGLDNLVLESRSPGSDGAAFRAALIRTKQAAGLFPTGVDSVLMRGPRLFRATLVLPANTPVGTYQANVFLFRNGQVVGAQQTPVIVSKVGASAEIVEFAREYAILYGLLAVAFAVLAGWLADLVFRKR